MYNQSFYYVMLPVVIGSQPTLSHAADSIELVCPPIDCYLIEVLEALLMETLHTLFQVQHPFFDIVTAMQASQQGICLYRFHSTANVTSQLITIGYQRSKIKCHVSVMSDTEMLLVHQSIKKHFQFWTFRIRMQKLHFSAAINAIAYYMLQCLPASNRKITDQ